MDMTTYLLMRDRWGSGSTTVNLQDKSVTPSDVVQYIGADKGYDGLSIVTMEAIPSEYIIPSGTISISANGSYNVEAFASAEVLVSGGGDDYGEIIERTITSINDSKISTIGPFAFAGASFLATVSFQAATFIDRSAFAECLSLTSVNFPNVQSISGGAFAHCSTLTSVFFPEVLSIGAQAQQYVDATGAFFYCISLVSAVFPKATTIFNNTFAYCSSLVNVSFPSATSIYNGAFNYCISLESVNFPEVLYIASAAFNNCSQLSTAIFPKAVTVGNINYGGAFMYCSNLKLISFPLAETIGASAFAYCSELTSASFLSLTRICSQAFQGCRRLLSLYLLGSSICNLNSVNAFSSTPIANYTTSTGGVRGSIFVPVSLYSSYISATNWATYSARFVSMTDEEIAALNI